MAVFDENGDLAALKSVNSSWSPLFVIVFVLLLLFVVTSISVILTCACCKGRKRREDVQPIEWQPDGTTSHPSSHKSARNSPKSNRMKGVGVDDARDAYMKQQRKDQATSKSTKDPSMAEYKLTSAQLDNEDELFLKPMVGQKTGETGEGTPSNTGCVPDILRCGTGASSQGGKGKGGAVGYQMLESEEPSLSVNLARFKGSGRGARPSNSTESMSTGMESGSPQTKIGTNMKGIYRGPKKKSARGAKSPAVASKSPMVSKSPVSKSVVVTKTAAAPKTVVSSKAAVAPKSSVPRKETPGKTQPTSKWPLMTKEPNAKMFKTPPTISPSYSPATSKSASSVTAASAAISPEPEHLAQSTVPQQSQLASSMTAFSVSAHPSPDVKFSSLINTSKTSSGGKHEQGR